MPLASLSAELVHVESEEALPTVLKGALRLLHADVAALSLCDRRTQRQHVAAVASTDGHWSPTRSLVSRVPPDFPPQFHADTCDVLVLPDDDPRHPFAAVLAQAASAAVYVALRYATTTLGTLHVVRPAGLWFSADDRALARGIGDHAVLALTTVRVV